MCRGVPARVLRVDGSLAEVDSWGTVRTIRVDLLDEPVAEGDYVLSHLGYAFRRIPTEDLEEVLALYDEAMVPVDGAAPTRPSSA